MCNNFFTIKNSRTRQYGVSLIMVLFLLVVVSLLAAALARLNQGGSNAVSMEVQSTRALFAAESGAQIAAMRIFPIGTQNPPCSNGNFSRNFTANGLNNCAANVSFSCVPTAERTVFTVVSAGTCGTVGSADYARRQITVGLRN